MPDETRVLLTIIVELVAPASCIYFNNYIDQRAGMRFNGETAVWVGLGVSGVLALATIVIALWWHALPQEWIGAVLAGAIIWATFIPSGAIMWWGDRVRYRNSKRAGTVIRKLHPQAIDDAG